MNIRRIAVLSVVARGMLAAASRHVITRIPVPGDYGWDYLTADSDGRRLYISHDREVVVINLDSGAIAGKVADLTGVHGIAIAPSLGRGFISKTDPGSVTIFDLKNLKTRAKIQEVRVGDDPNAILFDQKTQRVLTIDRGSKRVTALDAASGRIVATSPDLEGRTEHAALDGKGHLFVNMQSLNILLKLDAQSLKVLEKWPTAPCEQPSSMDIDRAHDRVFIGCRSGAMIVVDGNTGRIVSNQPIGRGVDAAEFDDGRGLVYFSTGGDGNLSVFHEDTPDKYTLVETVKTQNGARTLAVDHETGKIYLSVAEFGPPPAPAPGTPPGRGQMTPGSFSVLVVCEQ
jgi:DNA-binding beta-propeller fold protein YncE